jgi:ArsR family transcriptional regulator
MADMSAGAARGAGDGADPCVGTSAAATLLKALAHEGRLAILCHLLDGERSVGELESLIGARQAAVSQQLARLRHGGLVTTRRDGKAIHYAIGDARARRLILTLRSMFGDATGR